MKNLFVFLSLFLTVEVFAQKGFHLGVFGGPLFSAQLNNEDFDNSNVRFNGIFIGGAGGLAFNYHFNDELGLGAQVVYASQGFNYKNRTATPSSRRLSYVKVPVLFHVNSSSKKLAGGYFYIGPQFSFLVGKDFVGNGVSLNGLNTPLKTTYAGLHNVFTFGAALGTGIVFNILEGKLQVNAGLRLDADFLDAYKGKDLTPISNPLYNSNKPNEGGNYKYLDFDNTGLFAVDPATGKRSTTYNASAVVEVGIKYVFMTK